MTLARSFTHRIANSQICRCRISVVVLFALVMLIFQSAVDVGVGDEGKNAQTETSQPNQSEANQSEANQSEANPAAQLQTAVAERDLQRYESSIRPILTRACFDCHSGDEVEGNFFADQLDPDLVHGEDIAWWLEVYSVISKGEMPPDSDDLPDDQRSLVVDWLSAEIQAAEKMRTAGGKRSSFRRLTRYEYNYALQDLLGVPWRFSEDLPAESAEETGFENDAEMLRMSVKQVETYHRLAVNAIERITVRGEQPSMLHWSIPMKSAFEKRRALGQEAIEKVRKNKKFKDEPIKLEKEIERLEKEFGGSTDKSHYLEPLTGRTASAHFHYRKAKNTFLHNDWYTLPPGKIGTHYVVVQPGRRQDYTVQLDDCVPERGTMRVRIRASRAEGVVDRVPALHLSFGFRSTDQGAAVNRVGPAEVRIDAPFGQPKIYQWDIPLGEIEHRNPHRGEIKMGDIPSPAEYLLFTNTSLGDDDADGESSAVLIDHIEVTAPVFDQWPPRHHRRVFVDSENSQDETAYAREIISGFMARAWRKAPSAKEVERKVELFAQLRPQCDDFQQAIAEVLATVLTSPKFLYVLPGEEPGEDLKEESADDKASQGPAADRLSQMELATRLSLFLWCSLPDEALLELASTGQLSDLDVLRQQTERMLADPRAERFHRHFVQQWLKMKPLDFLSATKGEDGLDAALLESMKQEPIALFADMLDRDASVLEFIDSNYAVINERLAQHYGIPDVLGNQFRRVSLSADLNRGGLLTQAGMLTINSDGEHSHPVKRGVWLLTSVLNDPPPPPPAAVPEIDLTDPEILKLTLKQRIEKHRDHAACLSCHQKIDPWGIAFENYDELGRWRDQIDDQAVDASSVLPGDVSLEGVTGLKQYLIENQHEQFVRATVEKMAAFALGRQLSFSDRAPVTKITQQVRQSGDGLKSVVMRLVIGELFQAK